jgi:hypothetical protein
MTPDRVWDVPEVWIVLVEDHHTDVNAIPFSSEEAAVTRAREEATANARHPDDVEWNAGLSAAMRADGWVLYLPYGTEGDKVRVVRRQMDDLLVQPRAEQADHCFGVGPRVDPGTPWLIRRITAVLIAHIDGGVMTAGQIADKIDGASREDVITELRGMEARGTVRRLIAQPGGVHWALKDPA